MKGESIQKRFFDKVNKNGPIPTHVTVSGPCWEWIGGLKRGGGYGDIRIGRKMVRAHRLSWELHIGAIPTGHDVLHKCDNTKCVNPDHLFIGNDTDNVRDRVSKGRNAHILGDDNPFAKLTTQNVFEIRSSTDKTSELAKRYNVTYEQVWKIRKGRAWTHLLAQPQT